MSNEPTLTPYVSLLPSVIIWDVITQYDHLIQRFGGRLPCKRCGEQLHPKCWNIGQNVFSNPRLLHDFEGMVLLIGRVYVCTNKHECLSYSKAVTEYLFFSEYCFPFRIQYRVGFVTTFLNCLLALAEQGMELNDIVSFIARRRAQHRSTIEIQFWRNLVQLDLHQQHNNLPNKLELLSQFNEWINNDVHSYLPSHSLLTSTFVNHFYMFREDHYTKHMTTISCRGSISLDHTFKVASNIGYLRADGRWVTQYSALFIVLNENGKVMTWQFTKTKSYEEIQPLLRQLLRRIHSLDSSINTIYIDDCCSWRPKLQQCFGSGVAVKLDLFHAVQRVTKCLSKKHRHYYSCMKQLKLMFRDDGDVQEIRIRDTPAPEQILRNIDSFIESWSVPHSDILTQKALKEIDNLKGHIRKGCLSHIPPGMGTNRNEALHKNINPFFSKPRMSVHMAYALLTLLFYFHNERVANKCNVDVSSKKKQLDDVYSILARQAKQDFLGQSHAVSSISHDHCYCMKEFIGIAPDRQSHVEKGHFVTKITDSYVVEDTLEEIECDGDLNATVNIDVMKSMISNALNMTSITDYFKTLVRSPLFSYENVPHMSEATCLFSRPDAEIGEYLEHEKRLDNIIEGLNGKRIPIMGDGNCCFAATALAIKNICHHKNDSSVHCHFASKIGDIDNLTHLELGSILRLSVIDEWTSHAEYYQNFLTTSVLNEQVDLFQEDGFFQSELGNTTILALANFLETSIIVVASIANMPYIRVDPRNVSLSSPLFVAYNQHGEGHYDSISFEPNKQQSVSCRCGVNDKVPNKRCTMQGKYQCRCPCYNSGLACSHQCQCHGCENPHGKRPLIQTGIKRQRDTYPSISFKSAEFIESKGQIVKKGKWTTFEFFFFHQILQYLDSVNVTHSCTLIENIMNDVHSLAVRLNLNIPLQKKTTLEVTLEYEKFKKSKEKIKNIQSMPHLKDFC